MSKSKPDAVEGTDWTGLLADPDLARNFGKLLQTYRDAPPERREEALMAAMRTIKGMASVATSPGLSKTGLSQTGLAKTGSSKTTSAQSGQPTLQPQPTVAAMTPPFEPDIFTPNSADDRRSHPRIKCFVAVELRVDNSNAPIWGNLSNTSRGGCQVETAAYIAGGAKVEIGLWVASGKIWVKGMALNGVVTRSGAGGGVRIRFEGMDAAEKENLKQFLKYIQETIRITKSENSYMQLLK